MCHSTENFSVGQTLPCCGFDRTHAFMVPSLPQRAHVGHVPLREPGHGAEDRGSRALFPPGETYLTMNIELRAHHETGAVIRRARTVIASGSLCCSLNKPPA